MNSLQPLMSTKSTLFRRTQLTRIFFGFHMILAAGQLRDVYFVLNGELQEGFQYSTQFLSLASNTENFPEGFH